jgi:hypothetical protein
MSRKQALPHQQHPQRSPQKTIARITDTSVETTETSEWDLLKTSPTIESQSQLLGNPALSPIQRQALASRLGHLSGNRHLQRVLAHTPGAESAIQREDNEETSDPVAVAESDAPASSEQSSEESSGAESESSEEEHGHTHGDGEGPDVIPQAEGGSGKKEYLETEVALKVLEDSFGSYKKMTKGTVSILAQAEFQVAYDKIYGETQYSWEKYIKVKFGNLGGFAYKGVNYVNSNIASSTTVPHEMLHNNAHSDWAGFVGSNINEGVTEYLTFQALTSSKYTGMTSKYPNQYGVIKALVAVMGDAALKDAYFKGTNEDLRKAFNQKCIGAWVDFKKKMDESNWTQAKALAEPNK